MIWAIVYVLVTGTLIAFEVADTKFSLPLQTLILTGILVPSIVFVIAPITRQLADRIWP